MVLGVEMKVELGRWFAHGWGLDKGCERNVDAAGSKKHRVVQVPVDGRAVHPRDGQLVHVS